MTLLRFLGERREAASGVVLGCLLVAGIAEAASLGSLLPALSAMSAGGHGGSPALTGYVHRVLAALGVEMDVGNVILLAVSFMAVKALLSFAALSYAGVLAARVSVALRRRLVAGLFAARWQHLTEHRLGHLANALGNDAARAGDAYLISAQVSAYAIQAAAYIALNVLIDWRVALAGLGGGLFVVLALGKLVNIGRRAGYWQTDATARLATLTMDALASLKPITAMNRQHAIQSRIARAMVSVHRALVAREVSKAGLNQGSDVLLAVLIGSGLYLGHVVAGLPLPELIISGVGFYQILSVTSRLQRFLQQAVQLESAFFRTAALIDEIEDQREINTGFLPPPVPCDLRFAAVSLRRGGRLILEDVDMAIAKGEITVLQGHSGAGKTTIVDLVLGLVQPSGGCLLLNDVPLPQVDLWAWRQNIGYVPQELHLFHSSIRDNVTLLDQTVSDEDVWEALELAGAAAFVRRQPHGLDADVGEMGARLSGGERQRISLARALIGRPRLLVLDEVTSALDPETEAQVVANIVALKGRFTVLTISHRPAWTAVADTVYEIHTGRCRRVQLERPGRQRCISPASADIVSLSP